MISPCATVWSSDVKYWMRQKVGVRFLVRVDEVFIVLLPISYSSDAYSENKLSSNVDDERNTIFYAELHWRSLDISMRDQHGICLMYRLSPLAFRARVRLPRHHVVCCILEVCLPKYESNNHFFISRLAIADHDK